MNSDLIEISGGDDDDDSLLCLNGDVSTLSTTTVDFSCSPLVRSKSSSLRIESGSRDEDMCNVRGSADKENVSAGKLSIEPQKMKRKKKGGGGYNLRKSLAWDRAFFTEEGVLDPLELSMLSGGLGAPSGEMLSVIDEGRESLSGDLEGDSHDLQAVKDNLFKELPSSTVTHGQKTTSTTVSTLVPGSCGREKKSSSASAAKRKVLSAHDINRSALKRSGCPSRSVPSSSLKRPPNLNTTKAVSKEPKVSKLSTAKSDQSVVSAANRSSKTAANPPKCNRKALPAINPKTNVGTKSTFTDKKGSTSNLRSGPAGKPILKSSIRPVRNVVQPVSQSSINVHNLTVNGAKTNVKSDSAVSVAALPQNGHDGSTGRISVSFSQSSSYSGANMRQAQPQAAKPSGLRMPSPSIGFFDQSKPASSHGLPQKSTQLVRPSESGIYTGKVGGLNLTLQKPPLPPGKIPAGLDSGSSTVPKIDLNSFGKLKSNLEVKGPCNSQNSDNKKYEQQVNDVGDLGPQSLDVAGLAEPSKVEKKDAKSKNNNELLFHGTTWEQLKKDDAREAFTGIHLRSTEFTLPETDNPSLMPHTSHPIEAKGLHETKSTSCNEICLDTQFINMNNSISTFISEDHNNLPGRMHHVEEQSDEQTKMMETGSCRVHSVSSMNSPMLEVSGLSETNSITHNQICEDNQSIDMSISSKRGTSEVYEDLPGKRHGVDKQSDEQAKLMETDSCEVCSISIMNSPLLPVNDDILFETAHPEELSKCKSLEAADCSVQAEVCTPSRPKVSCSLSHCKDVEQRKNETSIEVQQDVRDAPVLRVDVNFANESGKNILSISAADNPLLMIIDDLGGKDTEADGSPNLCAVEQEGNHVASECYQDTDSSQAAQFIMLKETDPCESELKKMNRSGIGDDLNGNYVENEYSNICVVPEQEKRLPFEDQLDNNVSSVKSVSSDETNSYKDELKSSSILGSTPLLEQDCEVHIDGDVEILNVESAPTANDVKQGVQIISSLVLERTDEDNMIPSVTNCNFEVSNVCSRDGNLNVGRPENPLVTSQHCPVLLVKDSYQESTLSEQESDSLVLHNGCSTGSDVGNGIQQSLEHDKMITTDCFHDTEQENRNEDAYDGLLFEEDRSIGDSWKDENVIISETGAAGASGLVVPHDLCHLQKTEAASQLTVKETPMENVQGQSSHESLLADSCNNNIADSCNTNINSSVESTDYLMVADNVDEQPEEQPVLENLDHMIEQIYEDTHGLSSDNNLLPGEISNVEDAQQDDVPSSGNNDVLEHSNGCSTESETFSVCSLQTPALQGAVLEVDRKTEDPSTDGVISGSLEVEPSVENADFILVGEYEEDGKHRSQVPPEFESSLKNECQDPLAENSFGDKASNGTISIDILQVLEVDLSDSKTLAEGAETHECQDPLAENSFGDKASNGTISNDILQVVEVDLSDSKTLAEGAETHVVKYSPNNSELQCEMDNATKDKDVTISLKESVNEERKAPVIKPPPNAVPFSDEWLAAFEAAGEEILTMKSGSVQNSPPDKSQPEPSPWSPVKRKNNQGIGPFDCTKFTNTGIPPSSSN